MVGNQNMDVVVPEVQDENHVQEVDLQGKESKRHCNILVLTTYPFIQLLICIIQKKLFTANHLLCGTSTQSSHDLQLLMCCIDSPRH